MKRVSVIDMAVHPLFWGTRPLTIFTLVPHVKRLMSEETQLFITLDRLAQADVGGLVGWYRLRVKPRLTAWAWWV